MGVANITGNLLNDTGLSLSSYLPLTGGTLTGALSGTSATFSGEIKSGDTITLGASAVGGFWTWGASNSYLVAGSGKALNLNPNGVSGNIGIVIATSGNVGIGTSSPSALLTLAKDNVIGINTTDGADNGYLALSGAGGDGDNRGGHIYLSGNERGADAGTAIIAAGSVGSIQFRTGASVERMRINSSQGLVMADGAQILTTGGYYRLRTAAAATVGLFIQRNTWTGSGDASPSIAAETGYGIYTYTNGSVSPAGPYVASGGTSWTNGSSDIRKKKNFETTQGLAELLQIEPVKYHFLQDDDNSKKRLGFKAQNILDLIPEMVSETGEIAEDGTPYLTVTPDYILPVLVKAIQELSAKVTALENK